MAISPDTKDWTWVLDRPCAECGFDASTLPPEEVPSLLRANAGAWEQILTGDPARLRARPHPDRWSALEYACHVRDVFVLFDQRLVLMLSEVDPLYPNWDQDATAVEDGYGDQDPVVVSPQLRQAAETLALRFEGVSGDRWHRTGRRSDGASFTMATFGRYMIHDPIHHLDDVRQNLSL